VIVSVLTVSEVVVLLEASGDDTDEGDSESGGPERVDGFAVEAKNQRRVGYVCKTRVMGR
jgi:hypothetical protein